MIFFYLNLILYNFKFIRGRKKRVARIAVLNFEYEGNSLSLKLESLK